MRENSHKKNNLNKAIDLTTFLLRSLLYRLLHLSQHGYPCLFAFLCESWFTFEFLLNLNNKWTPVDFKTHPQILLQRAETELPAVDLFVATAGVALEPPIMTVNTVHAVTLGGGVACYVSDDGCSQFSRLWIPFCKRYDIQARAPFRYFSNDDVVSPNGSAQCHLEWQSMKVTLN
ncbi:cellulose synthase-like protein B4 [Humulus lupulus]|uniref:cellulose synthase-like protein B4 n=1 Tax=Humulus lupulus TaxID=3486 RepID=UPI002B4064A0|nr:cellulose synthase-like protein B4 [Humulus lupulus]